MKIIFQIYLVVFLAIINIQSSIAQNTTEKKAIKEWIIANKNNITLVSLSEYQKMSSTVKNLVKKDANTLIYDVEITSTDIDKLESKNTLPAQYIALRNFLSKKELKLKEELRSTTDQKKVNEWMDQHKNENIKIVSLEDYKSRPASEQAYIDALPKKIIFKGKNLTWPDIENYTSQQ